MGIEDDIMAARVKAGNLSPEAIPTNRESPVSNVSAAQSMQDRLIQMLTFGTADNIASAINAGVTAPFSDKTFGQIYNETQDQQKQFMQQGGEEHPYAAGAGTLMGAVMSPNLLNKVKPAQTLLGSIGQGMLSGAVHSSAQAAGEADEEGIVGRAKAAADAFISGGIIGGAMGAAGHGISKVAQKKATTAMQKATQAMQDETNKAYELVKASDEVIPGDLLEKNLDIGAGKARGLIDRKTGVSIRNPIYNTKAKHNKVLESTVSRLKDDLRSNLPYTGKIRDYGLGELEDLRKSVWDTYNSTGDKRLIQIIRSIDETMDQGAAQGSDLLKLARNHSRMQRNTEMFDEIMKKAERQAQSGAGDYTTAYKKKAELILDSEKYSGFLTDAEKEAMQAIISGNLPENAARFLGRFAPTSGHIASLLNLITMYHNPLLGGAATTGAVAAKKFASSATKDRVMEARRVLSGSPTAPSSVNPGMDLAKGAGQLVGPAGPSIMDQILPEELRNLPEGESLLKEIMNKRFNQ